MSQVFDLSLEEVALIDLERDSGFVKRCKEFVDVTNVVVDIFEEHDDVIELDQAFFHLNFLMMISSARWKHAGAFVRPNSIRKNVKTPASETNAVLCRSCRRMFICQ